jgi:hypothetical protein
VSQPFDAAAGRLGDDGARRFARWDAALYRDLCGGPGARLWKRLKGKPGGPAVLEAYLGLAVEAIGLGYIDRSGFDAASGKDSPTSQAPNLIALFWVLKIPRKLAQGSPEAQIASLTRLWNVGEGLLREPPWLNRYVTGALHAIDALDEIEARLTEALEPALTVGAPSSFGGPFAVTTIDASKLDELFLPGDMHLAAPAVLCVHDRKREGVHAGVFLRPQGASGFLSLTPCLGQAPAEEGLPEVALQENRVRIGGSRVALPLLARGHRAVIARAGFCVASAIDSQRLWIVESP